MSPRACTACRSWYVLLTKSYTYYVITMAILLTMAPTACRSWCVLLTVAMLLTMVLLWLLYLLWHPPRAGAGMCYLLAMLLAMACRVRVRIKVGYSPYPLTPYTQVALAPGSRLPGYSPYPSLPTLTLYPGRLPRAGPRQVEGVLAAQAAATPTTPLHSTEPYHHTPTP